MMENQINSQSYSLVKMLNRTIKGVYLSGLIFLLLTISQFSVSASLVDGYKDIKFGMTGKEISALSACKNTIIPSFANCYGKQIFLFEKSGEELSLIFTITGKVEAIMVLVGSYTSKVFKKYDSLLSKKYKKTRNFSSDEEELFNGGNSNTVANIYGKGAVELKIVRDKGKLNLFLVYNSKFASKLVMNAIPKETTSDDI